MLCVVFRYKRMTHWLACNNGHVCVLPHVEGERGGV